MTKALLRALVVFLSAAWLAGSALPAAAATLTYNDPSCAGFQITGSGGSFTLTCAKLSCSITGVTNPTTAQNTTLNATCTPSGASFLWNLVTGPFSDPTCNAPSTPTAATTAINKPTGIVAGQTRSCLYQVTGTASSLSGQAMATVTWSDAPPSAPVCTPTATTVPNPITSAGGSVNLNAGCVPSTGVSYTWTRTAPTAGSPTNPSSATPTDTLAANPGASGVTYTWQVVACTGPAACDTKSVSVIVPGSGGGGSISCTGFSKTIVVEIPWTTASPTRFLTASLGGMTPDTAVVIHLGAAPVGTVLPQTGSITGAEYIDAGTSRTSVLSTLPCDWTNTIGNQYAYRQEGNSISWGLGVAATAAYSPSNLTMGAGVDYYINVKNYPSGGGGSTCGTATCNMYFDWLKPH